MWSGGRCMLSVFWPNEAVDAAGELLCSMWRCESRGVDAAVGRRLPGSRPSEEKEVDCEELKTLLLRDFESFEWTLAWSEGS